MPCINSLDKYIGIPFVDGGRNKEGCDCWGLTTLVFKEFGIDLPDYKIGCMQSVRIHTQINAARKYWKKVSEPVAPCLVLMRMDSSLPKAISHVGTYIGEGRFIHTIVKQDSKIEKLSHPYYKNIIEGYYTYVG